MPQRSRTMRVGPATDASNVPDVCAMSGAGGRRHEQRRMKVTAAKKYLRRMDEWAPTDEQRTRAQPWGGTSSAGCYRCGLGACGVAVIPCGRSTTVAKKPIIIPSQV